MYMIVWFTSNDVLRHYKPYQDLGYALVSDSEADVNLCVSYCILPFIRHPVSGEDSFCKTISACLKADLL